MAAIETPLDRLHRYPLEQYHQLIELGALEGQRVELIEGLMLVMSPKSPEHEGTIMVLNRILVGRTDPATHDVGVTVPLTIGTSEPEPDLIVVPLDAPAPYHAAMADLVVEVAHSSLRYDLTTKALLYARHGLPLYWVVDINGRQVLVHTGPGPDGYGSVTPVPEAGELTAPCLSAPVAVRDVLARVPAA